MDEVIFVRGDLFRQRELIALATWAGIPIYDESGVRLVLFDSPLLSVTAPTLAELMRKTPLFQRLTEAESLLTVDEATRIMSSIGFI